MTTRTLESSPSILALYARSAASMLPGASLLPFVPGGGREIPDLNLALSGVRADPDRVAAYAKVCGFALREHLPPTYPHVLAFPLHMAIMADGKFPFAAVGLVHIENSILQQRPIGVGEEMEIRVRATQLQPHPRGQAFSLLSDVIVGEEKVWRGVSTMLRRGAGSGAPSSGSSSHEDGSRVARSDSRSLEEEGDRAAGAEWRLGGDLGRRYAAVSGDRNPIHMHPLAAKPFGFPRAIAHGMWTKARCLAALEAELPDAFGVEVRFRKPILLPARVQFASSASQGEEIEFAVRDSEGGRTHLEGRVRRTGGVGARGATPSER